MKTQSLFLAFLLLALPVSIVYGQGPFGENSHLTDVIVKVHPGAVTLPPGVPEGLPSEATVHIPEIASILGQHGATAILRSFPDASPADTLLINEFGQAVRLIDRTRVFRFRFPMNANLTQVVEALNEAPGIVFAQEIPEYELHVGRRDPIFTRPPNDPEFQRQWHLRHTGEGVQPPVTHRGRADIRALEAWNLYRGGAGQRIGIIDSGMRLSHEDLSEKVTGDGHMFIPDRPDLTNHGTHVGGIAGAITNNQKGVSGTNWHARLISRNIFEDYPDPVPPETIYGKIISALNDNVQILNNSWGGDDNSSANDILTRLAFAAAHNSNVLSIAGSGRDGTTQVNYPAGFWEVMTVGSSTHENLRSTLFSNYGDHLEVVAPGGSALPWLPTWDIYSTMASSDWAYAYSPGTSMAAPQVSGLASLIRGYTQNQYDLILYHDDLRQIIRRTTDRIAEGDPYVYDDDGWHPEVGFGRINAHEALLMVRDHNIMHGQITGGTSVSQTGPYRAAIFGAPGLASGAYLVVRHDVERQVTFPETQNGHFWPRSANRTGTVGWAIDNPNLAKGWTGVVPGSVTSNSATLRTNVYEVWTLSGSYRGFHPASPSNVTFPFTVVGDFVPPPLTVELTGDEVVMPGAFGRWTATVSGGIGALNTFEWWKVDPEGVDEDELLDTSSTSGSQLNFTYIPFESFILRSKVFQAGQMGQDEMFVQVQTMPPGDQSEAPVDAEEIARGDQRGQRSDAEDGGASHSDDSASLPDSGALELPDTFTLAANHPNPFSRTTTIGLTLPEASEVTLIVLDVLGREVTRIEESRLPAGVHSLRLDADGWPSGTYVYRIEAIGAESGQQIVETRRMTVVR